MSREIFNLAEASHEQMRSLQLKELEILKYFKKICEENNLSFFLGGGSCIGALRHDGFIPWDDDVDVLMLRPDYEKLYDIWKSVADKNKYSICRTTKKQNYSHAAMTINDNYSTFINFRTKDFDVNQGVSIDVLPMDAYPTGKHQQLSQYINAILFSIYSVQRLPDHQGKMLRYLAALPLELVKSKKVRYTIWNHAEKSMTKYPLKKTNQVRELVSGFKTLSRILPKEWFLKKNGF
ncbi:hypothetical protein BSQ39_05270 [Loigolactobacillus backii]|uniref:LicD family protein n=1 Tax=Loigolactobacillus backii TaxID=375175 RepID=UPI000C1CBA84|nr:LicD family protein [Loigolactobacillus backii]PIO83023.1 hypothetical protein BSQ39_05270 [Loigolactobacillus backii]